MNELLNLPKLHSIAGKDDLRPAMGFIEILDGKATSTDGHVLIRYKLSNVLSTEQVKALNNMKYIHHSDWKFIMDFKPIDILFVEERKTLKLVNKQRSIELTLKEKTDGNYFPQYNSLLSYNQTLFDGNNIGINPKLLVRLADSMQCDAVSLVMLGRNKPIVVLPESRTEPQKYAVGLIMPMLFEHTPDKIKYEEILNRYLMK